MRVGIVGTGLIGGKRANALHGEQVLVGAFDINQQSLLAFTQKFKTEAFETQQSLYDSVGPGGLIVIATNHAGLAQTAQSALEAGCHVLVEKPGARNAEEFQGIVDLAIKKELILRVGYNHRFHPAIQFLKNFTENLELGPVQLIRAVYGHGGRPGYESEWRASKELAGGGELLDQGSHLLDLCQHLVGIIELEFSSLPNLYWNMEVEDNAFMFGKSSKGAKLWLHASWTEWKNKFQFEVFYKTGKIEILGLGGSYGPESCVVYSMPNGLGIPTSVEYVNNDTDMSWQLEMEDVLNQISGKSFSGTTGSEALGTLRLIEGAYKIDNK